MEVASPLTTLPVGLSPGGGGSDTNMLVGHHHHHHHHHNLNHKRSLSSYISPSQQHQQQVVLMNDDNHFNKVRETTDDIDSDDNVSDQYHHMSKRRRFHAPTEIDSLSRDFSSHTLFFNGSASKQQQHQSHHNKSIFATNGASSSLKRVRMPPVSTTRTGTTSHSPTPQDENQPQPQQQQQDSILMKKNQELERVIQEQASLIESLQNDKVGMEKSFTSLKTDHERIMKDNTILRKAVTIQEERRIHLEQEMKSCKVQADEKIRSLEQMIANLRYHLQASSRTNNNDFMYNQRPPDVY